MKRLASFGKPAGNVLRILAIAAAFGWAGYMVFTTNYFRADRVYERFTVPASLSQQAKKFQGCHPDGCEPGVPGWTYTYRVDASTDAKAAISDLRRSLEQAGYAVVDNGDSSGPSLTATNKHIGLSIDAFVPGKPYDDRQYDKHSVHVLVMARDRFW
jgi:hypothetical protein